jgi:hypothetical protein
MVFLTLFIQFSKVYLPFSMKKKISICIGGRVKNG